MAKNARGRKQAAARTQRSTTPAADQSAKAVAAAATRPAGASAARPAGPGAHRANREAARASREAAQRSARRRRTAVRWGVIGAAAAGLIAFIVFVAYPGPDLGLAQRYEGSGHVEEGTPLQSTNRPPSSGPHSAARAAYGLSTTPVDPMRWIHVLEHGGMVVLYKCADEAECETRGAELRASVYEPARNGRFGERKITITPYQEMDAPITAVVWGRILPQEELDATAMLAFYERYLDRGPENAA